MLRRLRDYEGFEVWSRDGHELGRVEDFFFDEDKWAVRYVVVKAGTWLTGRSVLLSPFSIERLAWDDARIEFRLTQAQIERAPGADLEQPISRRWESEYSGYYGIPMYWAGPDVWGMWATPVLAQSPTSEKTAPPAADVRTPHVRSIDEVTGYHIHATDGEIGHVEDYLVDDESWRIRYLMIDTSNWIGGRTVLIAPEWAERIDWGRQQVVLDVTRDTVKQSPEYDPAADIDGKYERRLADAFRVRTRT